MKITILGATGSLGRECLGQALELGYDITVLVRSEEKLPLSIINKLNIVQGDALNSSDICKAIPKETDAVLFAIGVDKNSPEDLCTDITMHIISEMNKKGLKRFIWCGGGSTLVDEDVMSFGARSVEIIARTFLKLRHYDKEHQYKLLQQNKGIEWIGIRPLQMKKGPLTGIYRLGFHKFGGLSSISFADCAHAMVNMINDDIWIAKAPIIQY